MIQAAWKLDAINEWGSIVGLSYIAAQRVFNSYNDMADNKAFLESIARSFGYHYGGEEMYESIQYLSLLHSQLLEVVSLDFDTFIIMLMISPTWECISR